MMDNKNISYLGKMIFLLEDQVKKIPLLFFLFIMLSILDVIGLGLILPYVSLIVNPEEFYSSQIATLFNLSYFNLESEDLIIYLGIIIFTIFLIKGLGSILINYFILSFSAYQSVRLASKLMSSFQKMPYSIYTKRNSSEYVYSINSLANYYALVVQAILRVAVEIILGLAIFILLAISNFIVLFTLFIIISTTIFLYDKFFKNKLEKYGRLRNFYGTKQVKAVSEGLGGFKEVRILGQEKYFYNEVRENIKQFSKYYIKSNLIFGSTRYFIETVLAFFIISIVLFYTINDSTFTNLVPTLMLFGIATVRLAPAANQIINGISIIRSSINGMDILYNDINDLNKLNITKTTDINEENKNHLNEFESLKLSNVSFSYDDAMKKTINNINLEINNGDIVGIMGPSGSGKTSLVDVILGLLKISSGSIHFNQKNLDENLKSWQEQVAYLPQEIFILDHSLKENITLTADDHEIDEHKLDQSIKMAKLETLIDQLPDGSDTIIGEKGIRVSGGQRQRIALARAFYFERKVLIFDEATSALDSDTEKEIMREISDLKGLKTIILVAHRVSTLNICNKIYKLDDGKIVSSGTYQEVIEK